MASWQPMWREYSVYSWNGNLFFQKVTVPALQLLLSCVLLWSSSLAHSVITATWPGPAVPVRSRDCLPEKRVRRTDHRNKDCHSKPSQFQRGEVEGGRDHYRTADVQFQGCKSTWHELRQEQEYNRLTWTFVKLSRRIMVLVTNWFKLDRSTLVYKLREAGEKYNTVLL